MEVGTAVTAPREFDVHNFENEEARLVQQALLPTGPLTSPTFEIAFRSQAIAEVGGDFLDYFYLADGRLGFYLADVVGKGLSAAMYATLAMGTIRAIHKSGQTPGAVLDLFNHRLLVRPVPRRYCAIQYAVLNPATLQMQCSNAGLPYPIHVSKQSCKPLNVGGIPSGIFNAIQYEQYTLQLAPGDAVLFATDGLHEAADLDSNEFGVERLIELCGGSCNDSADALLDRVLEAAKAHSGGRQQDDVTAVVLKVLPAAASRL
ncbi:MAG: PP2C family protein-serine/threonine phosphatase [Candidatus Acidiferrales bacterium]